MRKWRYVEEATRYEESDGFGGLIRVHLRTPTAGQRTVSLRMLLKSKRADGCLRLSDHFWSLSCTRISRCKVASHRSIRPSCPALDQR